ncbi:regucalcin-like [Tribolium madens]|uniref:regucalcin-like n=1 Tax=Tribolium madens TaxID=41895 RepID=UPI001CF75D29|nr:regucalcin-like [Tribolium madens]
MEMKVFLILNIICSIAAAGPGVFLITDPVDHSECPTWDSRNNLLYFVNIHAGEIYRYHYENEEIEVIKLDGEIAPVIPSKRDPNLLIAGLNRSIVAVEWNQTSSSDTRILTTLSNQFPTSRVNDGKADNQGRLWIGTMGYENSSGLTPNQGVLYQVACKTLNSPLVEIAPLNISNGMAWNKANDKLYYIDTPTRQVVEYAYDEESGIISNRRVAFDMRNYSDRLGGNPDGMTIDEDDNLWVALFGGGAVIKVNPANGQLLQIVAIPAEDVTSVMWGGPNLDVLYVTTSRYSLSQEDRLKQPVAGAVFGVVGLYTKGLPMNAVDLLGSIDDQSCGTTRN